MVRIDILDLAGRGEGHEEDLEISFRRIVHGPRPRLAAWRQSGENSRRAPLEECERTGF